MRQPSRREIAVARVGRFERVQPLAPTLCSPLSSPSTSSTTTRNRGTAAVAAANVVQLPIKVIPDDFCRACRGGKLLLSTDGSRMTCTVCFAQTATLDSTAAAFCYGDEPDFTSGPPSNTHHFEDWLKSMQAKGGKKVDQIILGKVMSHILRVQKVENVDHIMRYHVHNALKFYKLKKLYQSETQIFCRITGVAPPFLTSEQEQACKILFNAIKVPYIKWKEIVDPSKRNSLSYSYCFYKFVQMLRWRRFLRVFSLLKQKRKLIIQETIFQGVCKDLNWEFIPLPEEFLK